MALRGEIMVCEVQNVIYLPAVLLDDVLNLYLLG